MKNPFPKTATAPADSFLIGCGFFVFAITALWTIFFAPMDMDEAGVYHVLACFSYPLSPLQTFRDSCLHPVTLTVPFFGLQIVQPERYIGILHWRVFAATPSNATH